jgi:hypothetical protein
MTRRFKTIIIANIFLGLLLYLSCQFVLINLQGFIVEGVNIFSISTGFVQSAGSPPVPTIRLPLANFPFYVFLAFLIVNAYFIIKDRKAKQTPT